MLGQDKGTVLVTGAQGFVGRALCARLAERGYRPRRGVRCQMDADAVVIGDIGTQTDLQPAVSGCAAVVHCAARVHVMKDVAIDPMAAFREVNVAGTAALARAAATAGVRRFVFLSSIKVNGEAASAAPFSETDTANPLDPYAISKWEAEQVLQKISTETGMEVVILRPALIYGPGVKANFLRMLQWVEKGMPMPLASVKNHRSLIYLGNLVDAVIACLEHPAAAGNTYLVSDGNDVSTPALICTIASAMGKPARLWPCPESVLRFAARLMGKSTEADRLLGSLQLDSSKIRRELGWNPPFGLQAGIQETVAWFQGRETQR